MKMMVICLMAILMGTFTYAQSGGHESGGRLQATTVVLITFTPFQGAMDLSTEAFVNSMLTTDLQSGSAISVSTSGSLDDAEMVICSEFKNSYEEYAFLTAIASSIVRDRTIIGLKRTIVSIGSDCSNREKSSEQNMDAYVPKTH